MRIFVNVAAAAESGTGETLVVGCVDTGRPVSTIVEELFARKAIQHVGGYQLLLGENGALLEGGSKIGEVLKDGDYVIVVSSRAATTERLGFRHVNTSIAANLLKIKEAEWLVLDGCSLTVVDLVKLGNGEFRVKLSEGAKAIWKVNVIKTCFGRFANVVISQVQQDDLLLNLLRPHSAGVGDPLSPMHTRMLLALRIIVLAMGYSGVRLETLEQMTEALNALESLDEKIKDVDITKLAGLCEHWQLIAKGLGFMPCDISDIESINKADADQRVRMLMKWIDKNGSKATYRRLEEVLRNLQFSGAADRICDLVLTNQNSYL